MTGNIAESATEQALEKFEELLGDSVHYDPDTGRFTWLPRNNAIFSEWNARHAGTNACSRRPDGNVIHIDGHDYKASRLAFLYMLGRWPFGGVIHVDGDPLNNKWENLDEEASSETYESLAVAARNEYFSASDVDSPTTWQELELSQKLAWRRVVHVILKSWEGHDECE